VKRTIGLAILLFVFTLFFYGCAYIDIGPTIEAGFRHFNSGDLRTAENCFREALRRNPTRPQANLGLSLVTLFRGNQRLISIFKRIGPIDYALPGALRANAKSALKAELQKRLLNWVFKTRVLRAEDDLDLSWIRWWIQEGQREIAETVALLEEAKSCLERALASPEPVDIFPNHLDWNQNGVLEPETPLLFSWFAQGAPVWKIIAEALIGKNELPPDEKISRFFDPSSGDAWFDKELFDLIRSGEIDELDLDAWEPVFDEEDVLTIGSTEMRWLYLLVTGELSALEPLVIYQLDFGSALQDFLNRFSKINREEGIESAYAYAADFLDANHDGKISNLEWCALFDEGFLAFRPEEENGGTHAVENWKGAIVGFCETMIWMIENDQLPFLDDPEEEGPFGLNLARLDTGSPLSERLLAILRETIDYVSDPTKAVTLFSIESEEPLFSRVRGFLDLRGIDSRFIDELHVLAYPGMYFAHPENFSDLKAFFPQLYYQWIDRTFPIPELFLFEDPAFGGLLQADINGHPWNGVFSQIFFLITKR